MGVLKALRAKAASVGEAATPRRGGVPAVRRRHRPGRGDRLDFPAAPLEELRHRDVVLGGMTLTLNLADRERIREVERFGRSLPEDPPLQGC